MALMSWSFFSLAALLLLNTTSTALALAFFQKTLCTNASATDALDAPVFSSKARSVSECACMCYQFSWCQAYVLMQNNACAGLDVTLLKSPKSGTTANTTVVYVAPQQLPLNTASTKLFIQVNTQDTWIPLPSQVNQTTSCAKPPAYPVPTYSTMLMMVRGRLVGCGGNVSLCFSLNPASNAWESFPGLPGMLRTAGHVMTHLGWWISGGFNGGGWVATSYLFSLATNKWVPGPSLPRQSQLHCLVKINATTYFLAGGSQTYDAWMYDWPSGKWTQKQNKTVGTYALSCAAFKYPNGSRVVIAQGGTGDPGAETAVESFSLTTQTWTRLPNMPLGTFKGAMMYDGATLVAASPGGNVVMRFNATDSKFYAVTGLPATGINNGYAMAVDVGDGSLHGCN